MTQGERGPNRRSFRIFSFRSDTDAEIEAELSFHFQESVEALLEEGWSEADARAEARRRFGDRGRYRSELEEIGRKKMRKKKGMDRLDRLRHDIGTAFRNVRRRPGFSALVIGTLALGIGANATMFEVVDRLLLRPPEHIQDAERVREIHLEQRNSSGELYMTQTLSYPDYRDFEGLPAIERVAAYTGRRQWTLGRGANAERIHAQLVTADYFPLLGVTPVRGRFFSEQDDAYEAPLTAVISQPLWQRRFGGDAGVLGRTIDLNGDRYEVIGITPTGFTGVDLRSVDVWVPLHPASGDTGWDEARSWWWVNVIARLADGVDDEAAAAQMTGAHRAGRRNHEQENPPRISHFEHGEPRIIPGPVISALGPDPSATSSITLWLTGVSAIVLLVACANVANLLLAQGMRTRPEHAIRVALGVDPGRLAQQLLTEAMVLSSLGAGAALLVAHWTSGTIHRVLMPDVVPDGDLLSSRFLVFLALATSVTALMAGLLPALDARRAARRSGGGLRQATRRSTHDHSRLRGALVLGQTALSAMLLVGAGLFVRSLWTADNLDLGFDADHTMLVQIEVDAPQTLEAEIYERAIARISRLPGVHSVAGTSATTPLYGTMGGYLRASSVDSLPSGDGPYVYRGTAGLFDALGVDITRGREFEEADLRPNAEPVIMVSERFADEVWPGLDPLTQCGRINRTDRDGEPPQPCRRVIGVFRDMIRFDLDEDPSIAWALPGSSENKDYWGLVVRTDPDPAHLAPSVRQEVLEVDDDIRFVDVETFASKRDDEMGSWRLGATMFSAFGGLAVLLAALGLYSVLSFNVARRYRELGIRAALGANTRDLVSMILGQAGRFVVGGLILGLVTAFLAGRYMEDLLFRVKASEPVVYLGVGLTLLVVGAAAAFLPAWRVTALDPTRAIEAD